MIKIYTLESLNIPIIPEDAFDDDDTVALFDEELPLDEEDDGQEQAKDLGQVHANAQTPSTPAVEPLLSSSSHDDKAFTTNTPHVRNILNDSIGESIQNHPLTSINHKSDSTAKEIEDLSVQRAVKSSPSITSLSLPSARARALAEHEDSSQIPKPSALSFTPAPLQTNTGTFVFSKIYRRSKWN